jgi:hypothetical protein
MIIKLSNEILDQFQMKNQSYLFKQDYYELESGNQEYRFYSYLSTFFNDAVFLDIGTLDGRSCIALSHNEKNVVVSYDIQNHINNYAHPLYTKKNVVFYLRNVLDDLTEDLVKKLKIVMIDIDHYETIERQIIDKLKSLGFKGIIILDDITKHPDPKINECMNRLWNSITDEKYDVTKYAHWSGTGVIVLDEDITFEFE